MRKSTLAAALLSLLPLPLRSQNPGQNVHVDIALVSSVTTADTTAISYTITNLATSTEPLWVFFVDAPTTVVRYTPSTGSVRWRARTYTNYRSRAGWMFLHDYVPASTTTPAIHYEAVGLPGILAFWAGGYFPVPVGADEAETDSTQAPDPFVAQMITGQTVGVEPWPTDRSAQALLARLKTLSQTSCAASLTWITDSTLCTQLTTDLDQAEAYRSAGQTNDAASTLNDYKSRLSTGSSNGTVRSSAFWLLTANADIVIARL